MFDFDTLLDRSGTGACKWDRRTDGEKARGIVPMSIADMEFACAPCVREAVTRAANHGLYGYTDPDGAYVSAVTGWMKKRHGWTIEKDDIVCAGGVIPAVNIAVRVCLKPGETLLGLSPAYYPFEQAAALNGRRYETSRLLCENGVYAIDFDDLDKKAAHAKALILCSPHNPVGRVWTADELARIGQIAQKHRLLVICDEIHHDIVLSGHHTALPLVSDYLRDNSIICTSPSKAFNLAGLQLANIVIRSPSLRAAFRARMTADGYSNISYFGYAAVIAAYTGGEAWLEEMLAYLRENDRAFHAFFMQNFPSVALTELQGTYLKWTNLRALFSDTNALQTLMRPRAGLILDAGEMFGDGGALCERFNIALPRKCMLAALERLKTAYTE